MSLIQLSGVSNEIYNALYEGLMDEKLKLKQLTLRMPENLHKEFKVTAVKEGRTMGDVTIELIRQYLKKASDPL